MINIYPKGYFKCVQEITIQYIIKNKIKVLILDVDNTLIDFEKNGPIIRIEEENGVKLDFSEKSIEIIPKLIEKIKNAYEGKKISKEYYDTVITLMGWYLGTTMLKNGLDKFGGEWKNSDSIPGFEGINLIFIQCSNGTMHFPFDKIKKYVQNGSVEDIVLFYKTCFELAER